jgi:L-ornithine N5-oxygenase
MGERGSASGVPAVSSPSEAQVLDVVGVGFGPSNLALAIAIAEADEPLNAIFLERQPTFGWHTGMLLADATMQVSFLKDLVTMRNPCSSFSFVNYLQEQGRLVDFINHKSFFPLRVEFHAYFAWAADRLRGLARYDSEVVTVEPVTTAGETELLDVVVRSTTTPSQVRTYRTRNLVIALGLEPWLPPRIEPSARVWHTEHLLTNMTAAPPPASVRHATVVGAGQSAAEAVAYLHEHLPTAEVRAVFSRYGYSPADNSPFVNRIFDPAAVDEFFDAPHEVKAGLLEYHRNTNYSVVDPELIDELYRRTYRESVHGVQRLQIMRSTRVMQVEERPESVVLTTQNLSNGRLETLDSDLVVFGTGYRPRDPLALLGPVGDLVVMDERGRPQIGRDHRLTTPEHVRCGIYLQGPTEHTHGLSSTLLSTTAVRAGELARSLRAPTPVYQPA